jgi:uncharacterized membrane protein YphA (DoxX/SURF4 family)
MANATDFIERSARVLPRGTHAHWLLRVPLALVLMQYGLEKFPISAETAAVWGLPVALWAMAALGEVTAAVMLVVGGLLRGALGDLVTRAAGGIAAVIVMGVLYVAYSGPPLDMLLFNQFHVLLIASGLYLALTGSGGRRVEA